MALNSGSGGGSSGAIRAGRAFVELFTKNNLAAGLNSAAADLKAFGRGISSIGLKFAGLGAAGAAALLPVSSTLNDIAKQGDIANALGLTAEQFTGIAGVAKSVGNDTKEFIESLVTMGKLGMDAAAGTEQASQAFASMGLNANEFIKLKSDEQFYAIFDALNKMQDPLARTRALMLAFGEDGGKILLPLLGKSGDELRRMAAGFAISSDDMREATKASTAYATATQTLSKAWQAVSIAAAPIVKILADGLSAAVAPVTEFVRQNREMVVGLGLAVGGVAALGVGMMALGPVITGIGASWGIVTGAVVASKAAFAGIGAILAAPVLAIPAALTAAGAAWLAFTTDGRATAQGWASSVKEAFQPTIDNITSSFSQAVKLFTSGNLAGAFTVALDAVKVEWARFMLFLQESWTKFNVNWERAIDATGIALVRLGRRLGIYDAKEAADIEKTMLDMGREAEKQLANPMAVKEARVELANAQDWQKWNAAELAKAMQQADITAKFRQAFAMMKGDGMAGNPLAGQLGNIALASRGTFGGSAGFFGGSGSVGEQIKKGIDKTNDLLEKQLDKMGNGNLPMPGGGLLFVGGK